MGIADTEAVPDQPSAPARDEWSAAWSTVLGTAVAAVVVGLAGLATDRPGVILTTATAFVLAALAAYDAVVRPTMVADPSGLTVRSGMSARTYPWPSITLVAVVTTRRLLVLRSLEIEVGDELVLLTRRRLGEDLGAVAARLASYGAPVR